MRLNCISKYIKDAPGKNFAYWLKKLLKKISCFFRKTSWSDWRMGSWTKIHLYVDEEDALQSSCAYWLKKLLRKFRLSEEKELEAIREWTREANWNSWKASQAGGEMDNVSQSKKINADLYGVFTLLLIYTHIYIYIYILHINAVIIEGYVGSYL